jgi:hypothetical protein
MSGPRLGEIQTDGVSGYTGTYQTPGNHNTLELHLSPEGSLEGHFWLGAEPLAVRGTLNPAGGIGGTLLDAGAGVMAIFRAWLDPDGLTLELDVPGPGSDSLPTAISEADFLEAAFSEAETLHFLRIDHKEARP